MENMKDKQKPEESALCKASYEDDCYVLGCPFCGELPRQTSELYLGSKTGMWHMFECNNPNCAEVCVSAGTLGEALKMWNTRAGGWIKIDDAKPELNTWCFISDGEGSHFAAYMDGLGFFGVNGEAFEGYVTHWMPLPAAPEKT